MIPRDIAPNEPCIRCVTPSKLRRGVIIDDVFLPFDHKTGASVLRLEYTSLDFCIDYGRKLDKTRRLGGLLKFNQQMVDSVNQWAQTDESKVTNQTTNVESINGMSAQLVYSPMDGKDKYVDASKKWYTDSCITTPMHADLVFAEPLEKGFVKTRMRKFNHELVKLAQKAFMMEKGLSEWTMENKVPSN